MPAIPMVLLRLGHHRFGGLQGEEGAGDCSFGNAFGIAAGKGAGIPCRSTGCWCLAACKGLRGSALSPFPAGGCKEVPVCPEKASPSPLGGAQGSGSA